MLIVNSRKTSLQIKKKFRVSFSPADFLLFSFQGRFFPKHASRGNRQKGLVRSKAVDHEPTVMLYSYTAMGGYGPAGSFQIWYDVTTPHFQEDRGGWSIRCLRECYTDVRCQSFNYVFTQDICELSNRTKEARPEDYVPNPERFYFKRDYKRGLYIFFVFFPLKTFSEQKISPKFLRKF